MLTIEKEHAYIRQIHDFENKAWATISWAPEAVARREALHDSKWKTREQGLQALESTVESLYAEEGLSDKLRKDVRVATGHLAKAASLRWELVVEIEYMVRSEARRLARLHFVGYEDLYQEGFLGALQAARRFEIGRQVRFATYARWWIRAQITRCIEHLGRVVRLPGGAVEQRRNIRRSLLEREQADVPVDLDEIAVEVGVSRSRLDELMAYNGSVSLETETAPGQSLKDALVFEGTGSDPESRVTQQSCMERCMERLPRLEPRQRYILENHYGLAGDGEVSLSQIGRDLGLSRERVRQLQKDALRRISRHL